jgi:hypothetical protein
LEVLFAVAIILLLDSLNCTAYFRTSQFESIALPNAYSNIILVFVPAFPQNSGDFVSLGRLDQYRKDQLLAWMPRPQNRPSSQTSG